MSNSKNKKKNMDEQFKRKEETNQPEASVSEKEATPTPSAETNTEQAVESQEASVAEKAPADKKKLDDVLSPRGMAHREEKEKKAPLPPPPQDEFDDDALLAELHALIGDTEPPKPTQRSTVSPFAAPAPVKSVPAPKPLARITADTLKDMPEDLEEVMEADNLGVPGWVKGVLILLISLLVCAMTFYSVAADLAGKVF
ncbi:MAG: hypothetical protein IIY94_04095 [Oscillospiraceae bacterium]|nr:hypothetical protein [Oscillospiraceae bacterium]